MEVLGLKNRKIRIDYLRKRVFHQKQVHINIMSKNMANMKENKKNNKSFNNRGYSSYVISLPYFLSKETVRSYYRMKDIRAYSTYGQSAWKDSGPYVVENISIKFAGL